MMDAMIIEVEFNSIFFSNFRALNQWLEILICPQLCTGGLCIEAWPSSFHQVYHCSCEVGLNSVIQDHPSQMPVIHIR